MKKLLWLVPFLLLSCPAWAQRVGDAASAAPSAHSGAQIAAVVNDTVVTTVDLDQRLGLALLSSGLPDTQDVRSHLFPQILRAQLDEVLQAQEAKRLGLSVSAAELDHALEKIGKDNKITGDMRTFVTARGASVRALEAQVRNGILWSKVIQREVRSSIEVSDEEVDAVIERIRANAGKREYLVSEIFLPTDQQKDSDQVRQVAEDMVQKIRSGASFGAVARQFSQGAGAAQGGDIGWIQQGQLAPELNKVLPDIAEGKISDPIQTPGGYHILGVREARTVALGDPDKATVSLLQLFRPAGAEEAGTAKEEAEKIRGTLKSCASASDLGARFPKWKSQTLGDMNPSKAPDWITGKIASLPVGGLSAPLTTDKGLVVLMVCARTDGGDIDREGIVRSLGTEKLERQAQHLMRDLRRSAYVDVRI